VRRCLEVEDFKHSMVFGGKEQPAALVIGGKVIEIARVTRQLYGLDKADRAALRPGYACVHKSK
jgi:hypothetical protein